jgi:hypothetical protein
MAAHRSVVAVRNSNWAENKSNRGRYAFHVPRKELASPPADGRGGVIVAAIHVLSPFVSPKGVVGMAIYTAKAMLHGKGNDRWEMLVENVPQPSERSGARRRITKTRRRFDARERARRSLRPT